MRSLTDEITNNQTPLVGHNCFLSFSAVADTVFQCGGFAGVCLQVSTTVKDGSGKFMMVHAIYFVSCWVICVCNSNTIVSIFDYIYKYIVIPPFMSCRSILHFM